MKKEQKVSAHIPSSVSTLGEVEILDSAHPRAGEVCDMEIDVRLGCDVTAGQSVELWLHFVSDMQIPQIEDHRSPAYFDAECSTVEVESYLDPLRKVHGEGAFFPYRRIAGAELHQGAPEGSHLVFHLQNIAMQTYEERTFNFRFALMNDDELCGYFGDAIYTVMGSEANHLRPTPPTCVRSGENFDVPIVICDQFGNKSGDDLSDLNPRLTFQSGEEMRYESLQYDSEQRLHTASGVVLEEPGIYYLSAELQGNSEISGTSNPIVVRDEWEEKVFWGDLHQHAYYLDGRGTPSENYRYAMSTSCLDFCSVCPHQSCTVGPPQLYLEGVPAQNGWDEMVEAARECNSDDFVTILGSEVGGMRGGAGDLNAYYLDLDNRPEIERLRERRGAGQAMGFDDIHEYLPILEDSNGDVLLMPHAHASGGPEIIDFPRRSYITNVEACSLHGNFEDYYRVWLRNGWQVGVHGGGDNHMPSTGNARPGNHYPNTNGLTGAWCNGKSRQDVWNAYKNRRTYAVTGNQRIFMNYKIGDAAMGEVAQDGSRDVHVEVAGTEPLMSVDLIRDGEVIRSYQPQTERRDSLRVLWTDNINSRRVDASHTSGMITADGANLSLNRTLRTYNRTDHFQESERGIRFRSNAYSGSWRGFIAGIRDGQPDNLCISICDRLHDEVCLNEELDVPLARQHQVLRLPVDPDVVSSIQTYTAEPISPELTFWVDWVDPAWPLGANFNWEVEPGSPCYVRVKQLDGNEAWSSAIWWPGGND